MKLLFQYFSILASYRLLIITWIKDFGGYFAVFGYWRGSVGVEEIKRNLDKIYKHI